MKPGDLVSSFDIHAEVMLGLLLDMEPMSNCYRDSTGSKVVYSCTVMWDRQVPSWMTPVNGNKRISKVPDSILQVMK
jgi:hypothetical protein